MSRTTVTQERVNEVADEIASTGVEPTYEDIASRLKTSNTTITRFFQMWKVKRPAARPVPPSLEGRAKSIIASIWMTAIHEANHAFEAHRRSSTDEVLVMAQQREIAIAGMETLQAGNDELQEKIEGLQRQCAELQVRWEDAKRLNEETLQLVDGLQNAHEAAVIDAGRARAELGALERHLARLSPPRPRRPSTGPRSPKRVSSNGSGGGAKPA